MMKAKSGFTLVEILIVVVILGILAAIVIPQFTEASTEAKLSSLCTDLQTLRSQIELFKVQHNDVAPTLANFLAQMTETSDILGVTSGSKVRDPAHPYGPYLQKIPVNQFNDMKDALGNGLLVVLGAVPDDAGSWAYDEITGAIRADDIYDKDGNPGADHWNL
jgi:general secretion pathway protein G